MNARKRGLRVSVILAVLVGAATASMLMLAPAARATVFSNPATITLPDPNCTDPDKATPYPSNITVSGLSGTVTDVNVTLNGVTHPFEGDLEILLVGPAGGAQNIVLLSDAGTGSLSNATVSFDDAAAAQAPQNVAWGPGTYKPSNYTELGPGDSFPAPAPAPSANATLASAFNGVAPNGTWSLYIVDDACPDAGSISGGWSLDVTTASAAVTGTVVQSSLNPSRTGQPVMFTATVTSGGPVTTGTVTFTEGATTLAANVPVNGSGQAAFSKSDLPEGNHIITATYNGTGTFATSSGQVNQRVDNNTVVTGNDYCNTGALSLPNTGIATPYPSNIFVTGAGTNLAKVTVTLKNVTHPFDGDIEALLVGPAGQNLVIVSDAGTAGITNVTVTFDDAALSHLSSTGSWAAPNASISAGPTNYSELTPDAYPPPAPAPSAATTLSTFNATNPNGTWALYVIDDAAPDTGTIAGGWCLNLTTQANPTLTTQASAGGPLGTTVTDTATLSNANNPTGTITFNLFGPGNATCAGAPALMSTIPVAGNGSYGSGPFTPVAPGTYRWIASYNGDANNNPLSGACLDANESVVITGAITTLATQASPSGFPVGTQIFDTATLGGGTSPTGTITFDLYGPDNVTCAGAAVFTSPVTVNGNGNYQSASFTTTAAGTYRWIALYSGDANNTTAGPTACNEPAEAVVVAKKTPTIATTASPNITLGGGTLTDTATVSGRVNPQAGATIDFRLYGPNDATCAGAPVFAPAGVAYPVAGGPVTSPAFTPTAAGTYRWIASYSGDANNAPVAGACNAANENVVVAKASPTISTTASPNITLGGGTLTDTAVVSGRVNPLAGATIDFRLYGPDDATCSGAPAFAPAGVAYPVAGGPVTSPAFTPTAAGTYRWIASYSGDANNAPVAGACNAANENVVVAKASPTISTQASAGGPPGTSVTDTATVSGGVSPTGNVTFKLFSNNTCTTQVFTSTNALGGGGTATSGTFTPAAVGTYYWTAVYNGDAKNNIATSACNAANESVTIVKASPTISTQASAGGVIGTSVTDTATVSGGVTPTGNVTFKLFSNNTCTTQVFTSTNALGGGGTATSGTFTPAAVGTYYWTAVYNGDAKNNIATSACNAANESVTIVKASPTISTQASAGGVIGTSVTDTATVSGGVSPTGNVTFRLFSNNTCTTQVFTSTNALGGGGTATSGSFPPATVGTYYWTAIYNGDAKNNMATSACNAANESVTIVKASPTISTQASAGGPPGTSVTDTATVSGGASPTGNVTFKLFSNNTCTTQVFTSTNALGGGGTATSGPFAPAAVGTYYWTAVYNGDAKNNIATSACNAANESVTIVKASPTISTQASPAVLEGGPVRDTATLANGFNPTGTVVFRLFSDNTCTTQVFTSTNAVAGASATSDWFTTAPVGTYFWTAVYSGDANNNGATSPCNAPNESVVVKPFAPPPCTQTLTGNVAGAVTVNSGQTVCITDAQVFGVVTVNPGGALTVTNSKLQNGIVANGPAFLSVCGSQVNAPLGNPTQGVVVTNANVPIRIGDPAKGCAFNKVTGDVSLTGNTGGLTLGANQVAGKVTVNNNTGGLPVVKANTISGTLGCTGNDPAPVNAGQPNTAAGGKTGQCAAL